MSGFSDPIIGGGGNLVYPSIQSPNFNTANPAASPSPSWAILKNGLAYFFGIVLTGGSITGPDYIINSSGIFIYSGTPAAGNLIGSWAGASGTDGFTNTYPEGLNVTAGAISGTTITGTTITGSVFNGTNFILNSSGLFLYSGTPALGNLIESLANATGTDAKGNAYLQGATSYLSASGVFTAANLNGGILSYWESGTAGGPFTQYAAVGFSWNSLTGGSLLLEAGNQVTFGQSGNAIWSDIAQTLGLPVASLLVTGETWHDMRPLSNSFVGTVSGQYPPQYRLMTDGYVEIAGFVQTPVGATSNYNSLAFATLPAAYRPGHDAGHKWPITMATNVAPVGTASLQVDTSGNLTFHGMPTTGMGSNLLGIYGRYPLDSTGLITV